jgi:hypothetical protein
LVIEGNKQRKNGERASAEDSYRKAQKTAPDYFPPRFDPKNEAAKPDPMQPVGPNPLSN